MACIRCDIPVCGRAVTERKAGDSRLRGRLLPSARVEKHPDMFGQANHPNTVMACGLNEIQPTAHMGVVLTHIDRQKPYAWLR